MDKRFNELYEKLSKLQWLLQRHQMQNQVHHGPTADPTRGQGRVLAVLQLQPEMSARDLSYLLGIRQQSLNELLKKLAKNGYITRKPSEQDRRVMMIALTEKGKRVKQPESDFGNIFDCLTEEEQASFSAHLDKIIAALEAQVGPQMTEEEYIKWARAARNRMSREQFEHIQAMHGGGQPRRGIDSLKEMWDSGFGAQGPREGRRAPGSPPRKEGGYGPSGFPGHEEFDHGSPHDEEQGHNHFHDHGDRFGPEGTPGGGGDFGPGKFPGRPPHGSTFDPFDDEDFAFDAEDDDKADKNE